MEKITREVFETWLKGCNWFKLNEAGSPNGQQQHYLTPAGEFVIAQYDLQGQLEQVLKPMAAPPQPTPTRQFGIDPRLDPRLGRQFPGS